jgi:hypothetical protein
VGWVDERRGWLDSLEGQDSSNSGLNVLHSKMLGILQYTCAFSRAERPNLGQI